MISLRTKQRENLDTFQAWMRSARVEWAKAHFNPGTDMVGIEMNGDVATIKNLQDFTLRQTTFGPSYAEESVEHIPVVNALREIIRFSVSHDDMLNDLAFGAGVTITIPQRGFMQIEVPIPVVMDEDVVRH